MAGALEPGAAPSSDVPAWPLTEVRRLMFLSASEMGWRTTFLPSLEAFCFLEV